VAEPPTESRWQRFLAGKTTGQRLLLALAAIAGAFLTIGAFVTAVGSLVDDDDGGSTVATGGEIRSGTDAADELVRALLQADESGRPMQLDTTMIGEVVPAGVQLTYGCDDSGACGTVKVGDPQDSSTPLIAGDGVSWEGCYRVRSLDGGDFGAAQLVFEIIRQGETCSGE
jgi:hypothetical protein